MESREIFLKGEIKILKKLLNESYAYFTSCSVMANKERFKKIIQLIFEINEKVITLKKLTKGTI